MRLFGTSTDTPEGIGPFLLHLLSIPVLPVIPIQCYNTHMFIPLGTLNDMESRHHLTE